LKLIKTGTRFDYGLFRYDLTSIEIEQWNINDNKTNLYLHFELFAMALCNFSKYLAKLTLRFDIVNITFLYIR